MDQPCHDHYRAVGDQKVEPDIPIKYACYAKADLSRLWLYHGRQLLVISALYKLVFSSALNQYVSTAPKA